MNKTLTGLLQELKNKGKKSSWVILKVVAVAYGSSRLPELLIHFVKGQVHRSAHAR